MERRKINLPLISFLNQINIFVGQKRDICKSTKLAHFIGYLRDYALFIAKHLSITENNYEVAIKMLKQYFLDNNFIINEAYKNIMETTPNLSNDPDFSSIKTYLHEISAYIYELKAHRIDL